MNGVVFSNRPLPLSPQWLNIRTDAEVQPPLATDVIGGIIFFTRGFNTRVQLMSQRRMSF